MFIGGLLTVLLSHVYLDDWKGWLFFVAGFLLLFSDPLFLNLGERADRGLWTAWVLGFAALLFYFLRQWTDMPVETVAQGGDSLLGRLRLVLLTLFLFALLLSFLYRLSLSLSHGALRAATPSLNLSRRRYLLNTLYSLFAGLIVFALVNMLTTIRNPSLDLTPGFYSFDENSRAIIKSVDRDVQGFVFLPAQQAIRDSSDRRTVPELFRIAEDIRVMVEQLPIINSKIKLEFLNADLDSDRMADFRSIANGTIIFRVLKEGEEADIGQKPYVERRVYVHTEKDLLKMEREITRSLIQVSSPQKTLYFTSSNGERFDLSGTASEPASVELLKNELRFYNFHLKKLDHTNGWPGPIPDDAEAVVVLGNTVPFAPEARSAMLDYLKTGGRLFLTIDPLGAEDFEWLLSQMPKPRYAFRRAFLSNVSSMPGVAVTDNTAEHRITENLSIAGKKLIVMPGSSYFETVTGGEDTPGDPAFAGVKATTFLYSAYRTILDFNRNGKQDGDEKTGRYALGIAYENPENKEGPKFAVFSGVDWLTNRGLRFPVDQRNVILAADTLFWLTESPLAAALTPKERKTRNIQVTDDLKFRNILLGMVLFPVLTVLVSALGVYFHRRKRSATGEG